MWECRSFLGADCRGIIKLTLYTTAPAYNWLRFVLTSLAGNGARAGGLPGERILHWPDRAYGWSIEAVPTLSQWGLMALVMLMAPFACRRRARSLRPRASRTLSGTVGREVAAAGCGWVDLSLNSYMPTSRRMVHPMKILTRLLGTILLCLGHAATAGPFSTAIEMRSKEGATLYVPGLIQGAGAVEWMVDTGSGYTTINEDLLAALQHSGQARFLKRLQGRLANGSQLEVAVYNIAAISIGESCWMRDVEAAVFPGSTRPILGLNVLQRTAPFIFSFEPPELVLSHCRGARDTS